MGNVKTIYQLKIVLQDVKPSIWRRFLVDSNVKLPDLHEIIQVVMGWTNSHLHQFTIDDVDYCEPNEEAMEECVDYRKIKLNELIKNEGDVFYYEYDFGDGWLHKITLEKILPYDKNQKYPFCIAGKRSCPPEDCGGPGGYETILQIIKNPKHEEYQDWMVWLGDDFDPNHFDVNEINDLLREG